jgi:EAL domain-containing protein (putative c-di-GMP-specific phosphodiesterase class I)
VLIETGLAPSRLELEITEGVLIGDFSRALSVLNRLKALGVDIALDDFGTGYSSLSYLHAFPFDLIKVDRTFVSDVRTNRHSLAIVRAVIGLGRSLGVPVLAEGVETEEQRSFLFDEGCHAVQGYLTGRPASAEAYAGLLSASMPTVDFQHVPTLDDRNHTSARCAQFATRCSLDIGTIDRYKGAISGRAK